MKITWLGHSWFSGESSKGTKVITDPLVLVFSMEALKNEH